MLQGRVRRAGSPRGPVSADLRGGCPSASVGDNGGMCAYVRLALPPCTVFQPIVCSNSFQSSGHLMRNGRGVLSCRMTLSPNLVRNWSRCAVSLMYACEGMVRFRNVLFGMGTGEEYCHYAHRDVPRQRMSRPEHRPWANQLNPQFGSCDFSHPAPLCSTS